MTPNEIRAAAPVGSDRTFKFHPTPRSSRVASIEATVVQHGPGVLYLGAHPALLALPMSQIVEVER